MQRQHSSAVQSKQGVMTAYFFSSHLEGMKRLLGTGAAERGISCLSSLNQLGSGSYGFTCRNSC